MDMTPEEKAAADAAAAAAAAAAGTKDAAYWEAEAKKAFKDRDAYKAQVKDLSPAAVELEALKKAQLTELELAQVRVKELEGFEPKAKALEATVISLLEMEIKGIDPKFLSLVPEQLDPAARLLWVRNAKEQGVFGIKVPAIGDKLPNADGGKTIKRSAYNALPLAQFGATAEKIRKGELVLVED